MSHTVIVERRTNGTFAPLGIGEAVRPNEAIRLSCGGCNVKDDFRIEIALTGEEVLRKAAGLIPGGTSFLDVAAPSNPNTYKLKRADKSAGWLLPITPWTPSHDAEFIFNVSPEAPPPPGPPPTGGFPDLLGQFKGLGVVAIVLVGLVVVSQFVRR